MSSRRWIGGMLATIAGVLLCATVLTGCTAPRRSTPNAEGPDGVFRHAGFHNVTTRPYVIDPPDEIIVIAPRIPELNGQRRIVQPDGTVVFPLLGPVRVAGRTPNEARELIRESTARFYLEPDIELDVLGQSKFFYVFGFGAQGRGRFQYIGRVTVVNALAQAGFTPEGWPQQVWLSRPGRDGNADATVVIDFRRIERYGDLRQNYLIEEGDIINIPYSPLASWNEKLNRLLGPLFQTANAVQTPANLVRTYDDISN